ncbi:MAG: hypothetical protein ACXVIG_01340 [Halobacteriota archaeon]
MTNFTSKDVKLTLNFGKELEGIVDVYEDNEGNLRVKATITDPECLKRLNEMGFLSDDEPG